MNPPKMPIHIGDYKRDTGHLRAAGHGAYLLLMFHYWSTGGLPDDDEQLAAIACMTKAEWAKHKPVLQRFFKDGGWSHKRIDADLEAAKASYEKRAEAGKRGGNAKASVKQSSSNATAGPELPNTLNLEPDKKDIAADAAAQGDLLSAQVPSPPAPEARSYAFESGIIRLNHKDFAKWKKAYSHLELEAELLAMTRWASEQGPEGWFFAVQGALTKRNRELGLRLEQNKSDGLTNDERYFGKGRIPGVL